MKRYLLPTLTLLLFAAARLHAQGICDSIITMQPILPACEATAERYLEVSHPGGLFSGPGVQQGSSYVFTGNVPPGNYTIQYTITGPGGCTVSTSQPFEVRDAQNLGVTVIGKIDCTDPNSSAQLFAQVPNGFAGGDWEAPESANPPADDHFTTKVAGLYRFIAYPMDPNLCPAFGDGFVKFENNSHVVNIEDCTFCGNHTKMSITVDSIPTGWNTKFYSPLGHIYSNPGCFNIAQSGPWYVEVTNPANGCRSSDTRTIDVRNPHPYAVAGTDFHIFCGNVGYLNGAIPSTGGNIGFTWTTTDGQFVGASDNLNQPVDKPGTYVLSAFNTFTGCVARDTVVVKSLTPFSSEIAVICAGENYNGYTQTGTYLDTIVHPTGCVQFKNIKLFVLAPIVDLAEILPDDGSANGSIDYTVDQGWPPFTYEWSNGETGTSLVGLTAGTYTVTVTDANDCQYISEFLIPVGKQGTRFRDMPASLQAQVYPNPLPEGAVGFQLEVLSSQATEATLLLHDVLGRNIMHRTLTLEMGKNTLPISENLPKGVYTLFLQGNFGRQEVVKLVVE